MSEVTRTTQINGTGPLSATPGIAEAMQRIAIRPTAAAMAHRVQARTTQPTPLLSAALDQAPLGRITVDYTDKLGRTSARLDTVKADTYVTTDGTIAAVNVHGTEASPRATFSLVSTTGDSCIVAVGAEVYQRVFGDLVVGQRVQVRGTVRRPFADMPAFLQLVALRRTS